MLLVLEPGFEQPVRGRLELIGRGSQPRTDAPEFLTIIGCRLLRRFADQLDEVFRSRATVALQLATDEVDCLDAVGPLVDRGDACVAH